MVRYDPRVIQKYADRLYSSATAVIILCTLVGALSGAGWGTLLGNGMRPPAPWLWAGIVGAVFGIIGWGIGIEMAFRFKIKAQLALCQMTIELNTRRSAAAREAGAAEFPQITA